MNIDLATKEDLKRSLIDFRQELLDDIKKLIGNGGGTEKEWLKSDEVRKMLGISAGTLQNLRIAGKLTPSKIGGTYYYRRSDIEALLSSK